MRTLRDVLVQMKGIWSHLEGGQKLVVATVLFATLAGLGGIVWFGRPGHEVSAASGKADASGVPPPASTSAAPVVTGPARVTRSKRGTLLRQVGVLPLALELLDQLPDRQRLAIVYMKLQGLSVAETARLTGMSEAAVKVSVHRGLKALAAHIASE